MRPVLLTVLACFTVQFITLCFALRDRDRAERANLEMRAELVECGRVW